MLPWTERTATLKIARWLTLALSVASVVAFAASPASPASGSVADLYQRGDYARVIALIEPRAARGDVDAQAMLGQMYAKGQGVPANLGKASSWLRKAADQGSKDAEYMLGVFATGGVAGPRDPVAAAGWFRKAGHQRYAAAAFNLALMYARGDGVERSSGMALNWIDAAIQYLPRSTDADRRSKFEAARSSILAEMTPEEVAAAGQIVSPDGPVSPVKFKNVEAFERSLSYPLSMRRAGGKGTVITLVLIGAEGRVLNSVIETSSGYAPLDEAVLSATRLAEFIPNVVDGKPVAGWHGFKWVFTLK